MKQVLMVLILGGILYAAPHGVTRAEANQSLTAEDKIALQSALLDFFEQGGDADGTFRIIDRTTGTFTMEHVNCNEDGPVTGSGICVKDKKPERRKF